MKREDFERNLDLLSFDEIEEDDFMLNTPTRENKDIFDMALDFIEEDNIVDTQAEQDLLTGVELDEMTDLPQINVEVLEDALMLEPEVTKVPEKEEILEFDIEEEIEIPAIEIEIKEEPKKVPNIEVEVFEMKEEVKEELKEDDKIELKEELSLPEEKEEKVKALEELEPKVTPIKANKEEREAYVLSNLKEIKKIKDEVIREVKLKQLAAETRISLAELEKRLEKLPQPRKVSSKNEEPSLAEAKIEPQLEVEADKIKEENKKASNIEVEVFEIKEEEPKEEVKEEVKEEKVKTKQDLRRDYKNTDIYVMNATQGAVIYKGRNMHYSWDSYGDIEVMTIDDVVNMPRSFLTTPCLVIDEHENGKKIKKEIEDVLNIQDVDGYIALIDSIETKGIKQETVKKMKEVITKARKRGCDLTLDLAILVQHKIDRNELTDYQIIGQLQKLLGRKFL